MKRLAIYAHYGNSPEVAGHVRFYLRQLAELGFQICFVSNSPVSAASETALKTSCERVIVRENTGLDFSMWRRGLAECDPAQYDELLLANSSVIGPLRPLAPLWRDPALAACDFWGLTDNDEYQPHLQSYFLVFRRRVLRSERFREFWPTVLPFRGKQQVILSYELGLSQWLEEGGFQWRAVFPRKEIAEAYRSGRSLRAKFADRWRRWRFGRRYASRSLPLNYPEVLLQRGMPFLKAALLREGSLRITPAAAFGLLEQSALPPEILAELRQIHFPAR